jgi:hypothetical protein
LIHEWTIGDLKVEIEYHEPGKELHLHLNHWLAFLGLLAQLAGVPEFVRFEWTWNVVSDLVNLELTYDGGVHQATLDVDDSLSWENLRLHAQTDGPALTLRMLQVFAGLRPRLFQAFLDHRMSHVQFTRIP